MLVDFLNKLSVDGTSESLWKLFHGRQAGQVAVPTLQLSNTNCDEKNENNILLGQIFSKEPKLLNMAKLWRILKNIFLKLEGTEIDEFYGFCKHAFLNGAFKMNLTLRVSHSWHKGYLRSTKM